MFDYQKQFNAIKNNQQALDSYFSNMQNFVTPGYRSSNVTFQELINQSLGTGIGAMSQHVNISFSQGPVQKTGLPADLALNGNGFFVLWDGHKQHYTRAGRFGFKDGKLVDPTTGMAVQGYALGESGNHSSKNLSDINLQFDPVTKLYGGKYTGFKFDDGGKLYGEMRVTDPLTMQTTSTVVPIFQVGVASFANPGGLTRSGTTTFAASELSGDAVVGVSGEGALANVVSQSLEMSNISLAEEVQKIMLARQNYEANFAAFRSMDKMTETAIGLIR